jgi:hypothetical protein
VARCITRLKLRAAPSGRELARSWPALAPAIPLLERTPLRGFALLLASRGFASLHSSGVPHSSRPVRAYKEQNV